MRVRMLAAAAALDAVIHSLPRFLELGEASQQASSHSYPHPCNHHSNLACCRLCFGGRSGL